MDFFLLYERFGEHSAQVEQFGQDRLFELGEVTLAISVMLDLML